MYILWVDMKKYATIMLFISICNTYVLFPQLPCYIKSHSVRLRKTRSYRTVFYIVLPACVKIVLIPIFGEKI